jgi:geranylgeranyl pyrophosphate synthase
MTDLAAPLDQRRLPEVDAALQRATRLASAPEAVAEAVRYAVRAGGKRLRPLLVIAGYQAFRDDHVPEPVYDLAAAVELIHAYSLVHDDLPSMDDDDVRRGRPATHVAHGTAVATVAGAGMIVLSLAVADEAARALGFTGHGRRDLLLPLYVAAGAGGMVGGQALDLQAEGVRPAIADLEQIHRRKTAALLGAAPRLGGAAAGARPDECEALEEYGVSLGLAFQIADDILDVTGSTVALGKKAGRDDELGKATFASIEGVGAARTRALEMVDAAKAALRRAGIRSPELEALARYAVERDR